MCSERHARGLMQATACFGLWEGLGVKVTHMDSYACFNQVEYFVLYRLDNQILKSISCCLYSDDFIKSKGLLRNSASFSVLSNSKLVRFFK